MAGYLLRIAGQQSGTWARRVDNRTMSICRWEPEKPSAQT